MILEEYELFLLFNFPSILNFESMNIQSKQSNKNLKAHLSRIHIPNPKPFFPPFLLGRFEQWSQIAFGALGHSALHKMLSLQVKKFWSF